MSSGSNSINLVPKLGSTNYSTWKMKMEMVLVREKLWGIVCERKPRPDSGIARQNGWDEEAERATATIFLCLSESAEKHVQGFRNPVEIWKKLRDIYEVRGFSARFILWRNLFSVRLTTTMDAYINQVASIRQQLKSSDFTVPDEVVASVLLYGLDPSWEGFISATTQAYRQKATIDPDELINQLLDEDRRGQADIATHSDTTALVSRGQKRRQTEYPPCAHCNRNGHHESKCWQKTPTPPS